MIKTFLLFLTTATAQAAEIPSTYHQFPEHLVESSSTDVLLRDRYAKVQVQKVEEISSSGGLTENLDSNLPFPVTQQKTPGTQSSFVGFGRSSAETNVQTLGVPLNSAQGGGFDLSSFPAYLWSSTRYQIGPSVAAYDPQGVGGTLSLKPWSDEALSNPAGVLRLSSMGSSSGVGQFSVGSSYGGEKNAAVAGIAGTSVGKVKGPSGAISGRWGSNRLQGKYHFLASRLDAETPGSKSFPTPDAHQITQRIIPVFELNYRAAEDWLVKSTLFYDSAVLKNEDTSTYFRDSVKQGGGEVVALQSDWLLSGGYRDVSYYSATFGQKSDQNYHFGAAYRFFALAHEWQPSLRGVGEADAGLRPAGSLGARHDYYEESDLQLFHYAKAGYQPRFASLVDRFYNLSSPGFTFKGNPDLKPEDTYFATLGGEFRRQKFGFGLEGNYQKRQSVQINQTTVGLTGVTVTPQNQGEAWLASVMPTVSAYPIRSLDLHLSATWSGSHIDQTDSEIPYVPRWAGVSRLVLHEPGLAPLWEVHGIFRAGAGSFVGSTQRTTGYGLMDGMAVIHMNSLNISARVDNILGRVIEWVPDFPGPGRTYSLGLTALF